jgi:glucokinase
MATQASATVLAGDIGGTKTSLGLYRVDGGKPIQFRNRTYVTHNYSGLEGVVADFLGAESAINAACFGVPGPVIGGLSHATNVRWTMREAALSSALGTPGVRLINDLEATAYGMLHLEEHEKVVLQRGEAAPTRAPIAIIAAGTGLGEGALVPLGDDRWRAIASEGGHSDFAPRGREQIALLEFLAAEFDHVSVERVLSGQGLINIYRFLKAHMPGDESGWLSQEFASGKDAAAIISEAGLANRDPRCVRALEIMAAIYGAEAANLALKFLALGGVFLGGGIAPKILPMLTGGGRFMQAFLAKGRFAAVLEKIPVQVSLNQSTALLGAAHCAMEML